MADIAHTLPAIVTANDGSTFGFERPGLQITQFDAGPTRSRDWLGYNLRAYDLDPSLWQSGTTALQEWSAFWHHIGGGSECGYIVEPVSETHRDLVCGGIADGTQTTFPIPVVSPSSVTVFVDGVPQESSAYTVHSAANLEVDSVAEFSDVTDMTLTAASGADSTGVSLDGLSCVKITPAGGTNPNVESKNIVSVSGEVEYTCAVWVLCTNSSAQNFRCGIYWYENISTYTSSSSSANVSIDAADGWTAITLTATSPAVATLAKIYAYRNDTTGTDPFYLDCFALNPGDYTRWHLPSQSPGLIEFASAPAAGARITATATGKRVSRCRFEPGSSWRVTGAGHAASRSIRAVEDIEV